MDQKPYATFGEFFRAVIIPQMIANIEPALNHLRQTKPDEWLRIAMQLRQLGPYDRIEHRNEAGDALKALIDLVATGLTESVPEFVKQHNAAMELHYIQHGLELDDMIRKHPHAEPMSARESVDAQLRAMGINIKPDDPR